MQAIHADNVTWKAQARGVREASIYSAIQGSEETRIDMVEVPAGSYIPPHRHSARTEFITILASAGAQLQIGERVFRPIAGQVFHREPGDVLALTNDSQHPFCYSVVRFRYEASDLEYLGKVEEEPKKPDDEPDEAEVVELGEPDGAEVAEVDEPESDDDKLSDTSETKDVETDEAGSPSDAKDSKKAKKTEKASKTKKSKGKEKGDSSDQKSGSKKSKKKSSKGGKKKK